MLSLPKISNITLTRAAGTVTEGGSSPAEYDAIQFKKKETVNIQTL